VENTGEEGKNANSCEPGGILNKEQGILNIEYRSEGKNK
jgi:hypothetical protein